MDVVSAAAGVLVDDAPEWEALVRAALETGRAEGRTFVLDRRGYEAHRPERVHLALEPDQPVVLLPSLPGRPACLLPWFPHVPYDEGVDADTPLDRLRGWHAQAASGLVRMPASELATALRAQHRLRLQTAALEGWTDDGRVKRKTTEETASAKRSRAT